MNLGTLSGPSTPPPPAGSPSSERGPSLPQRFARLFHAPRLAFTPPVAHSVWICALLVLFLVQFAQGWLLHDLTLAEQRSSFERSESFSDEQREEILKRIDEGYDSPGKIVMSSARNAAAMTALTYLLSAACFLLALNFGFGARASFREVLAVTAFSNLVAVLRELIRTPLMISQETLYVFLSPAAFVNPENRALLAALDRFDVFTLYRLALLTLGFAAITGLSPRRTAVPVLLLWLIVGLLGVAFWLSPIGKMFG